MTIYNGSDKLKSIYVGSENTNCIYEVPNNIIYTITNGRVVLKSGSYIYVPNGAGIFTKVAITSDITSDTGGYSGLYAVAVNASTLAPQGLSILTNTVSSGTAPESPSGLQGWYDTTNNIIKRYNSGWQATLFSLPIVRVTSDGTNITTINRLFNWWGYIGSRQFFLPGIKGLKSNGFKVDGTYNNILVETDRVIMRDYGYQATNQQVLIVAGGTSQYGNGKYYDQKNTPPVSAYSFWHNKTDNFNYYIGNDTSTGWVKNTTIDFIGISNINTAAKTFQITDATPAIVQPSTTPIKIGKIYNGSDKVYASDPYPPGTVLLNINSGGTGTVNFYKGRYRIYAQGGGGGGGSNNFWNNGSGGGSGAGFDGIVKFTQDMLNVACSTGAAPGTSGTGATTTIGSIFSLGGGRGGGSASAGAGGTYSYKSGSGYSIESSTVARNGDAGKADGGAGWGAGANSVLTGTGSNGTAGGAPTALGAGGTGGAAWGTASGGRGSGGECKITYVGQ